MELSKFPMQLSVELEIFRSAIRGDDMGLYVKSLLRRRVFEDPNNFTVLWMIRAPVAKRLTCWCVFYPTGMRHEQFVKHSQQPCSPEMMELVESLFQGVDKDFTFDEIQEYIDSVWRPDVERVAQDTRKYVQAHFTPTYNKDFSPETFFTAFIQGVCHDLRLPYWLNFDDSNGEHDLPVFVKQDGSRFDACQILKSRAPKKRAADGPADRPVDGPAFQVATKLCAQLREAQTKLRTLESQRDAEQKSACAKLKEANRTHERQISCCMRLIGRDNGLACR